MNAELSYNVSILIPVYGVEKYIERCAHSLFSQTYENIEYIFVDDCSPDKSIEVLKSVIELYPHRKKSIKILKLTINRGVGITRKTAFEISTGNYILFVDSDDYIEKNMVELMINQAYLKKSDIVFCSIINEYENGDKKVVKHIFSNDKKEILRSSFSQPSLCNKMFRRDIITKNKIKIHEDINYGEDLSFTPRVIYYSYRFSVVDKLLYHYVIRNKGSYTSNFTEKHVEQTLFVVKELDSFFKNIPDNDLYLESIKTLKAIRKAKILRSGFIELKYLNLYPELNNKIFMIDIDMKTKLILYFAKNKYTKILKFIVGKKHI